MWWQQIRDADQFQKVDNKWTSDNWWGRVKKFKLKSQQKGEPTKDKLIPAPEPQKSIENRHPVAQSLVSGKVIFKLSNLADRTLKNDLPFIMWI